MLLDAAAPPRRGDHGRSTRPLPLRGLSDFRSADLAAGPRQMPSLTASSGQTACTAWPFRERRHGIASNASAYALTFFSHFPLCAKYEKMLVGAHPQSPVCVRLPANVSPKKMTDANAPDDPSSCHSSSPPAHLPLSFLYQGLLQYFAPRPSVPSRTAGAVLMHSAWKASPASVLGIPQTAIAILGWQDKFPVWQNTSQQPCTG